MIIPFALAGLWVLLRQPWRHLPDPAAKGTGDKVELVFVDGACKVLGARSCRKIIKSDAQWREELTQDVYAVTRRGATEFAFANRLWNEHRAGLYRCACCGTALFRSQQKFESGTGWPSFTAPLSPANIATRDDRSLAETRTEVLCHRCDAHLGHVFNDGPPPTGLRYCLNSAALNFFEC